MVELKIPRLGLENGAGRGVKEGFVATTSPQHRLELISLKERSRGTQWPSATKDARGNGASGATGTFAPTPAGRSVVKDS